MRQDAARCLLASTDLQSGEIAFLLGFEELPGHFRIGREIRQCAAVWAPGRGWRIDSGATKTLRTQKIAFGIRRLRTRCEVNVPSGRFAIDAKKPLRKHRRSSTKTIGHIRGESSNGGI